MQEYSIAYVILANQDTNIILHNNYLLKKHCKLLRY